MVLRQAVAALLCLTLQVPMRLLGVLLQLGAEQGALLTYLREALEVQAGVVAAGVLEGPEALEFQAKEMLGHKALVLPLTTLLLEVEVRVPPE